MIFNNFILLFEKAYTPAFNLTMTVAAARIYGPEVVGNLALVFAFSALGQYLTSRGTDQNIHVIYASSPTEQLGLAAFTEVRKRLMRLFASVLALAVLYFLTSVYLNENKALFFGLLGATLGATSACVMPNEIRLIVTRDFRSLVTLKYVGGCLAISIGLLLMPYSNSGTIVMVGTLLLEKIIYLVLTLTTSRKVSHLVAGETTEAKKIPMINIHVLISAAAIFGYNRLDQVYIYGAFSSEDLGVYFATVKLFEITNLIIMAAITAKLHIMADIRQDSSSVLVIEKRLLVLSCSLVAVIAISAPLILSLVFDIEPESYSYVYILAAGTLFGVIGAIKGPWVAKNNRFHINTYFTIAGSIVAIGLLILYEPDTLAMVAVAMAFGQLVVNVLCPLMLKDERDYLTSLVTWYKK
jgi:O-antigen/teichoic acid export membrane protein